MTMPPPVQRPPSARRADASRLAVPSRLAWAGWGAGLMVSVAAHVGAAALMLHLLLPDAPRDQPLPKSALRIETQSLPEARAKPGSTSGTPAPGASNQGLRAPQGKVPQSRARPEALPSLPARPAAPPPLTLAQSPATRPIAAAAARTPPLAALPPPPPLAASAPRLASAAPQALPAEALSVAPATGTKVTAPRAPPAEALSEASATGTAVTATLAWSGEGPAQLDPVSLQAIAAFMRPGDAAAKADALHDGMSALLAAVPCARLQAEFDPATGRLALRGHVPEAALRAPLLAALRAELGPGIPVQDDLVLLPRPQCGALSGIADLGLPQSQDQLTNPRLIGPDAQARSFSYSQGQALVLDLTAPDYPAFVYVDFFDADGNVIHLVPNQTVTLRQRPAGALLHVGAPDETEPALTLTIGPPYGQEIAAAFAASTPLYDGVRPLSEPAAPYLAWLKTQVAEARTKTPDFKGEWVYFMVTTRER